MKNVYLVRCWTGADSNGVFTTLEAAQSAVAVNFPDLQWVPVNGMPPDTMWEPAAQTADTPEGTYITRMELDTMYWA